MEGRGEELKYIYVQQTWYNDLGYEGEIINIYVIGWPADVNITLKIILKEYQHLCINKSEIALSKIKIQFYTSQHWGRGICNTMPKYPSLNIRIPKWRNKDKHCNVLFGH